MTVEYILAIDRAAFTEGAWSTPLNLVQSEVVYWSARWGITSEDKATTFKKLSQAKDERAYAAKLLNIDIDFISIVPL